MLEITVHVHKFEFREQQFPVWWISWSTQYLLVTVWWLGTPWSYHQKGQKKRTQLECLVLRLCGTFCSPWDVLSFLIWVMAIVEKQTTRQLWAWKRFMNELLAVIPVWKGKEESRSEEKEKFSYDIMSKDTSVDPTVGFEDRMLYDYIELGWEVWICIIPNW